MVLQKQCINQRSPFPSIQILFPLVFWLCFLTISNEIALVSWMLKIKYFWRNKNQIVIYITIFLLCIYLFWQVQSLAHSKYSINTYQITKAEMCGGYQRCSYIFWRCRKPKASLIVFWWLFLNDASWTALDPSVPWSCYDRQGSISHLESCFSSPHIVRSLSSASPPLCSAVGHPGARGTGWGCGGHMGLSVSPRYPRNLPWWLPPSSPLHLSRLIHLSLLRWQQLRLYKSIQRQPQWKNGHRTQTVF